ERLLDRENDNRCRLFAVDRETALEGRIGADPGAPIDPVGFVRSGDEKDQPDAGILDEVLEAVEAIIAAAVGDQQGAAAILDLDKAGGVALGRTIESLAASRRQDQKR